MKRIPCYFLSAFFLVASGAAHAADVGRVLLAVGDVVAVRDGKPVRLALGTMVQDKDVLRTGPASNLQARFTDESILSLRENTEIRIEEYRFTGKEDGTERAFFRLVKGGLRAITGLIGRTNHANYRMGSVVATIGIRGTDYVTRLCQQDCVTANPGHLAPDGQYGQVLGESHGTRSIDFSNEREARNFRISESFYTPDAKSPIQQLLVPPNFLANQLEGRKQGGTKGAAGGTSGEQAAAGGVTEDPRGTTPTPPPPDPPRFVATEERTGAGPAVVGGGTPVSALVFAFSAPNEDWGDTAEASKSPFGTIQLDSTGTKLEGAFALNHPFLGNASITRSGAPFADLGSFDPGDGTVYWGRWGSGAVAASSVEGTLVPPTGIHWMFGTATDYSVIAAKTATAVPYFTFAGAGTNPTDSMGNVGVFDTTYSGFLVNFVAKTLSGTVAYSVGGNSYTLPVPSTTPIQNSNGAATFGIAPLNAGSICSDGCTSINAYSVGGVFTGTAGKGLAVTYATDHSSAGQTAGAQLFKCSPSC
ncbi:MAG: FecR domain-containing protein [Betaproteobacteria bacterium]|nr:FecR domain-containing protein [Betaproteobacteria bacterium]